MGSMVAKWKPGLPFDNTVTNMQDNPPTLNFWIGNGLLAVAMLLLLFMGAVWEQLGVTAMILWIALVIAGVYFLMKDKGSSSNMPG